MHSRSGHRPECALSAVTNGLSALSTGSRPSDPSPCGGPSQIHPRLWSGQRPRPARGGASAGSRGRTRPESAPRPARPARAHPRPDHRPETALSAVTTGLSAPSAGSRPLSHHRAVDRPSQIAPSAVARQGTASRVGRSVREHLGQDLSPRVHPVRRDPASLHSRPSPRGRDRTPSGADRPQCTLGRGPDRVPSPWGGPSRMHPRLRAASNRIRRASEVPSGQDPDSRVHSVRRRPASTHSRPSARGEIAPRAARTGMGAPSAGTRRQRGERRPAAHPRPGLPARECALSGADRLNPPSARCPTPRSHPVRHEPD